MKEVITSGWLALRCWGGYDQKGAQGKLALVVMTAFYFLMWTVVAWWLLYFSLTNGLRFFSVWVLHCNINKNKEKVR